MMLAHKSSRYDFRIQILLSPVSNHYATPKDRIVNDSVENSNTMSSSSTGVAEPGGPGGPWPPQKFEWVGQGMFWPPQNLTTGPPKLAASCQTLCQIASEHPEMCKIFKIFRLRRAIMGRTYSSVDFMLFRANFSAL